MSLYGSIDLHSNNSYAVVTDEKDRIVRHKKLHNRMADVDLFFKEYKGEIDAIVVESTFNGYWLLDGLMGLGYKVKLVHTTACKPYSGLKYTDDISDCVWLNRMTRLGVLPCGYIYPKEERSLRDLARKRMQLVNVKSKLIVALKQQLISWKAIDVTADNIERMEAKDLDILIEDPYLKLQMSSYLESIKSLHQRIKLIEKAIAPKIKIDPVIQRLMMLKGIGPILSFMIRYETGDIQRFKDFRKYLSYSGLVESKRMSNQKKKGKNNAKNRNLYLRWAFAEVAIHALRIPLVKKYHDRLVKKKGHPKAKAILASKYARAIFMIIKDPDFIYKPERLFNIKAS